MNDIASLTPEELTGLAVNEGEKSFRGRQIYEWIHKKYVSDIDGMTNLSLDFRKKLKERYRVPSPEIIRRQVSETDGTRKFLLKFHDGATAETVLMKYRHGWSQCISSQIGCRMGCAFCASGINGLERNLTAGEMLSEIYTIEKSEGVSLSNVVVMGTGEPLDNYENLVRFIKILTSKEGRNLGGRQIAVSTCGLVPKIKELADEQFPIALALSLHAPFDELRKKLMPVAQAYSVKETIDAMRYYQKKAGRRVTIEYSLIRGVNDGDECATELSRVLKGLPCLINLIPVNDVAEKGFRCPDSGRVRAFQKKLENSHNNVTIRRAMGTDIDGACGQLRMRFRNDIDRDGID